MNVDAERLRVDVRAGDVGIDASVDPHRPRGDALLALERGHRLVEQLHVELEADGGHVAGLLRSEQFARAADLEVAHGDGEAGAELGVVGQRREPRTGLRGQLARVGIEEVCVGGGVGPADAAADLVELGEAEHVGALDDEGVRLRDVDSRLDDGRRDEHVGIAAQESVHPLLELLLAHLTVGDEEAEVRTQLLQLRCPLLDGLDPVVEEERLALGIGVALSVSTSTSSRSDLSSSFCATPKRCSSSRITSPSSFGITSRLRIRCVPTSTSTLPALKSARIAFVSFGGTNRETISTRSGQSRKRSRNVLKCCSVRIVVGARNSTCRPFTATANAARTATSVLPKPTSPQTRRSIGRGVSRSSFTASIAPSWSGVSR